VAGLGEKEDPPMARASVRYFVHDVDEAIAFYERLGFEVEMHPAPGFAMLGRDGLRLLLNTPGGGGGAGRSLPDGSVPQPGGWNRFQVEVDDLDAVVDRLGAAGVGFRSGIVAGNGGRQVVADDPSGNPVELFEPGPAGPR
jgi:catechol 2,3-dioxygenase-like lactoylglutathione lyase family enzyme